MNIDIGLNIEMDEVEESHIDNRDIPIINDVVIDTPIGVSNINIEHKSGSLHMDIVMNGCIDHIHKEDTIVLIPDVKYNKTVDGDYRYTLCKTREVSVKDIEEPTVKEIVKEKVNNITEESWGRGYGSSKILSKHIDTITNTYRVTRAVYIKNIGCTVSTAIFIDGKFHSENTVFIHGVMPEDVAGDTNKIISRKLIPINKKKGR